MAISYITGIPGSGKSYYAVYQIWYNFIREPKKNEKIKTKDYKFLYTNINGFKFDKNDKFKPLDMIELKSHLTSLYALYQSGANDDELNSLASDLGLNYCLIIIDECHNFFTKKDDEVLIWWLTYHRHLYQDIILITQDLSLVDKGYKAIAEYFYKALPAAVRLFKNSFRYQQFTSYQMYQKDLINRKGIHIPLLPQVFALYKSGDMTSNKSYVRKFIYISLFIMALTFIGFNFFIDYIKGDIPEPVKNDINLTNEFNSAVNQINTILVDDNKTNHHIYIISCLNDECSITNKDKDRFLTISKSYLYFLLTDSKPIYNEQIKGFKGDDKVFIVFEHDIFNHLKIKGVSDDKKGNNTDMYNPEFSFF